MRKQLLTIVTTLLLSCSCAQVCYAQTMDTTFRNQEDVAWELVAENLENGDIATVQLTPQTIEALPAEPVGSFTVAFANTWKKGGHADGINSAIKLGFKMAKILLGDRTVYIKSYL